jgi:hypothetical protein
MQLPKKLTASGNVLVLLSLMYFITYVDRVNISTAASTSISSTERIDRNLYQSPMSLTLGLPRRGSGLIQCGEAGSCAMPIAATASAIVRREVDSSASR